jgi:chemotaxis protein methyltransferase CheR/two-component system CheB/CheR fusion protein
MEQFTNGASKNALSNNHHKNVIVMPYVVGIGASAGGLEAFEDFFTNMPITDGIAYVVIQHLDPTQKGMLPELLQRITPLKVVQATNHIKVIPNYVYVIPPNKDLSIYQGKLLLTEPVAPRGLRLPINFFFSSLAADQKERAIGIILSGMGSDGTIGLKAIKENAGLVLVQEPETAKFDAMPRSVINAGLADVIGPAQELPAHIIEYLNHAIRTNSSNEEQLLKLRSLSALDQIILLLREHTRNDFSLYKKNTINRRIERRMSLNHIDTIAHYVSHLRKNPQEVDLLFKEMLIGVTSFFRDPEVWEVLKIKALPSLLDRYPDGAILRAWVPACSTGEEAYSLAMLFLDVLDTIKPKKQFSMQIFASDIDEDAINFARQGLYQTQIETDVSPQQLSRYFTKEGKRGYRVQKNIREMVIFASQNIIMDPPFTKMDIVTCRNLLIYLGPQLQKKLIPLFHYSLNHHGILLLGNAETIGGFANIFLPFDIKSHLYTSIEINTTLTNITIPQRIFPVISSIETEIIKDKKMSPPISNLKVLADQILLQSFTPAAVLTNKDGDIIYINGRTGKYLEAAAGKANWNIYAMAREGLRHEIEIAMKRAKGQTEPVHLKGISFDTNGGKQTINLTVQAITSPEALRDTFIIVFHDIATPVKPIRRKPSEDQKLLLNELQQAWEEVQTMRENMQNSQEELKATNEELQSTNEELQSTNEELTTSKEEMQSLNEELQTVNTELQSKVEDLSWVNNDMTNLLNSTEIATIFLDNFLKVRRFTTHINQLFKLITCDIGRPLSDIVTDLDYDLLQHDAMEVLRTLVFIEKQVRTKDNRWFNVRIMPYRTQDNVIDGVVITFTNITGFKALEAKLRIVRDPV